MMQKPCKGDFEIGAGSHSYFQKCERPDGHKGSCSDYGFDSFKETLRSQEWVTQAARVSYPVDANGAPL